jgi:hypothetical protein
MTEKQAAYTPYCNMETGLAQLAAMEMAIKLDDDTRRRQATLIRALWYVVGVQAGIILWLAVFT